MTNADCIRRMNDEQLYEFLSEWECGDIDYSVLIEMIGGKDEQDSL